VISAKQYCSLDANEKAKNQNAKKMPFEFFICYLLEACDLRFQVEIPKYKEQEKKKN
jgi:hypothetical protein